MSLRTPSSILLLKTDAHLLGTGVAVVVVVVGVRGLLLLDKLAFGSGSGDTISIIGLGGLMSSGDAGGELVCARLWALAFLVLSFATSSFTAQSLSCSASLTPLSYLALEQAVASRIRVALDFCKE